MSSMNQSKNGAKSYDRVSKETQLIHLNFIMSEVDVKKGWKILDMGCGSGCDTAILSQMVGDQGLVVGIDPIKERIEVAKENYQNDSTKFHVAYGKDASKFGTDYFDLVVSNKVLHWIPTAEKELTFQSIAQCLKPSGQFIASFLIEQNPQSTYCKLLKLIPKHIAETWTTQLFYETKEDMEKMALRNGFNRVVAKETVISTTFQSVEDLVQLIASAFHVNDFAELYQILKDIEEKDDDKNVFMCNDNGKYELRNDCLILKCAI